MPGRRIGRYHRPVPPRLAKLVPLRLIPLLVVVLCAGPRFAGVVHRAVEHGTCADAAAACAPVAVSHGCCPAPDSQDGQSGQDESPDRPHPPHDDCPTCTMLATLAADAPEHPPLDPPAPICAGPAPIRAGILGALASLDRPRGRAPPATPSAHRA